MSISSAYKSRTNKRSQDELLRLLQIAEEEGIQEPEKKITPLERVIGALRATETSGIASDIQQGKGVGEAFKNYASRIGKGWTGKGLDKEDLSGVEGYKDILAKEGVSTKGIFGGRGPSPAGIGGFVGDVLLDPLTYVSGGFTAAGKTAAKQEAKLALKELAEKSGVKLADDVVEGLAKKGAKQSVEPLGRNAVEQAAKGQRSILNIAGRSVIPKQVNEFVYGGLEKGARKLGGTQVGETVDSFRKIFQGDNMVKLSEFGTDAAYAKYQNKLASTAAKNLENSIKTQSYQSAMEFRKQALDISKQGGKKANPDVYTDVMREVMDRVERTKPGEALDIKGLDEGTAGFAQGVKQFRDDLHKKWTSVGGKELGDEEIGYWIHTLPYQTKDKIAKQFGYSAREFTDKVASDLTRGYMKVRDPSGAEIVVHMKKLKDSGWQEIDVKGLPKGLFSGNEALTFKRLQENARKKYGIDIKYVPEEGMYRGAATLGLYQSPTRKMKIATKRPFEDVLSTQYHETVHALDALMGEVKQMGRTPSGKLGKTKKALSDFMSGMDKVTKEERDGIIRATGEIPEAMSAGRKAYRTTPTELWAWAAQFARENPEKAAKYFPKTASMLPELENYLTRFGIQVPTQVGGDSFRYGVDKLLYNKKTGEVTKAINATIKEINESVGEKFSTDIPYTAYMMGSRIGKKSAGVYYLNLVQGLGRAAKEAPEGYLASTSPMLKDSGLVFSPEIKNLIDNTHKAYFSDEAVKDVLNVYDKVMGVWKTSVTALFPSFHTRNFVSNVWQNWLGGVRDPRDYVEATNILAKVKRGGIESLNEKQAKLYQSFLDNGLSGFGYFGGDVGRDLVSEVGSMGTKKSILTAPQRAYGYAKKQGLRVGGDVENVGKLAHFINKVANGYSSADAAASVRKYLFDYADLTPTEKSVFKRLMPFYTFTRKNLPMELEALISNPSDFANLAKLMRAGGYSANRQEELPSYMRESPMYKRGDKFVQGGILDVPALEPVSMVGDGAGRTLEKLMSKMLSPAIKTPMEVSMDRSMFQGRPLSDVVSVEPVQARMLTELGFGDALKIKENKSKDGDVYYTTSDPATWHIIRNIFARFYGIPTSVGKLRKEDVTLLQGFISFSTGIQPKTTGSAEEAGVNKETVETLKKLLKSKDLIYEGSYIGKPKR